MVVFEIEVNELGKILCQVVESEKGMLEVKQRKKKKKKN